MKILLCSSLGSLLLLVGCGASVQDPGMVDVPPAGPPVAAMPQSPPVAAAPSDAGDPYAANPSLRVSVIAPPTSGPLRGEAGGYKLKLKLTNTGSKPISTAGLNLLHAARRGGVDFVCNPELGALKAPDEPTEIAAGKTIMLERDLPCVLPVSGKYEVRTYLRLNANPGQKPEAKELVATYPVEVGALPTAVEYPYPSLPGLIVVITSSAQARPLTLEEAKKGLYNAAIEVTNTSAAPVELKDPRVVFSATRGGQPVKCSPEMAKTVLQGPRMLEPGRTHRFTAPVQCDLTAEGQYDVNGFVSFGNLVKGGDSSTGKLIILVSNAR
jgi:hypothetical protein